MSNSTSSSNSNEKSADQETAAEETDEPPAYCNVIKKVKKENITPDNIGEIMLCQIPGISATSAIAVMKEFHTVHNLIAKINESELCLKDVSYLNAKGQSRRINKTVIANIIKYLKK